MNKALYSIANLICHNIILAAGSGGSNNSISQRLNLCEDKVGF